MTTRPPRGKSPADENALKALFAEVDKLMLPEMPPNYPPMMLYDGRVNAGKTAELLDGWRRSLREFPAAPVVYVHVPFCQQICDFCGFYRKRLGSRAEADAFLDRLSDEASLFAGIFKKTPLRFLCIGGGTPSMLSADQLARLFRILRTNFIVEKNARIAFEASPMTLDRAKLELLKAEGVNFLAIGVQSLNDRLMASFSRRQRREKVLEVLRQAKEVGVENVEVDLMVGLPGEDPRDFLADARTIGALDVERIYLFDYQPKYKTLDPGQRSSLPAGEIAQARKYRRQAMDHLLANGYNMRCGHWVYKRDGDKWPYSYDQQEDGGYSILGLGPSSVSYAMGRLRYENISDTGEYARLTAAGRLPVLRGAFLTERDELINKVLLDLLHRGEVSRKELGERFSPAEVKFAEGRFKNMKAAGVLVENAGKLALVNRERGVFELRKEFFEPKALAKLSGLTGITPGAAAPAAAAAPARDLLLSRGDKSVKELSLTDDSGPGRSFRRPAGRRAEPRDFRGLAGELLLLSKRDVRELILTGDEPLLHPRFGELLRLAGKLGFEKLSLFTGGSAGTEAPGFCEELRREGLDAAYLGLHSHLPRVHDRLSGGDAFAKALKSAGNLAAAGIELNLVTLLSRENLAGVPDQLRFFREKFGDIGFHLVFPRRQKRGRGAVRYLDADGLYARLAAGEKGLRGVKFYNVPPCRTGRDASVTGDLIKGCAGDGRESAVNADMVKLNECNLCKYLLVCPGPGPDYLAEFGDGEISAVKNPGTGSPGKRPGRAGKMR